MRGEDGWVLVDEKSGEPVPVGSARLTFRGEPCVVEGWSAPSHGGSSGRVYVRFGGPESGWDHSWEAGVSNRGSYFPSVVGCKVVPG